MATNGATYGATYGATNGAISGSANDVPALRMQTSVCLCFLMAWPTAHPVACPATKDCCHWLQYCDRGSMEKACEQNRFMNKLDGKPDMV